jgi:hypothetical protein
MKKKYIIKRVKIKSDFAIVQYAGFIPDSDKSSIETDIKLDNRKIKAVFFRLR